MSNSRFVVCSDLTTPTTPTTAQFNYLNAFQCPNLNNFPFNGHSMLIDGQIYYQIERSIFGFYHFEIVDMAGFLFHSKRNWKLTFGWNIIVTRSLIINMYVSTEHWALSTDHNAINIRQNNKIMVISSSSILYPKAIE